MPSLSKKELQKIYNRELDYLFDGIDNINNPYHFFYLSTTIDNIPFIRTIVLRDVKNNPLKIYFNADIRSPKVNHLKINPNCSILFYGKKEKIQLRMKIGCEIHYKDEITKESWDKTGHISRKCYLVTNGPGTLSDKPTSGLDNKFDNFDFTKEESEEGYKNFCVIRCKIKSVEWLYLAAKGHRRALFDFENNKKDWLVP